MTCYVSVCVCVYVYVRACAIVCIGTKKICNNNRPFHNIMTTKPTRSPRPYHRVLATVAGPVGQHVGVIK